MNLAKRVALFAATAGLAACAHQSYVPSMQSTSPSQASSTKAYFTYFAFPGDVPVAMAADAKGNLWFSACLQGAQGPCKIGYFDRTLKRTLIGGTYPFVRDLTLGPDGNMWFDQGRVLNHGYYIGQIDSAGKVKKFHVPGWQTAIVGGPDGKLWFDDDGYLGSIHTDGTGFQKTPIYVLNENGPLVFGPDMRLYFEEYTRSASNYPMCALTMKTGKLQCFAKPKGYDGASPLFWVGKALLAQPYGGGAVFAMSTKGKQWSLQNGTTFAPGVFMQNGRLAGVSAANSSNGLILAQLTSTGFRMDRTFYLPTGSTSCDGNIQSMVTTSDGYVWLNVDSGCLARFEVKQ